MQIPAEALEKIDSVLDHIVIMKKGTFAAAEPVHFTYVDKTKAGSLRSDREPTSEIATPVHFQKYVIILGIDDMRKLTQAQKVSIIAEQFARVCLGSECTDQKETEVEKLIESWGFRTFSYPHNAQSRRTARSLVKPSDF